MACYTIVSSVISRCTVYDFKYSDVVEYYTHVDPAAYTVRGQDLPVILSAFNLWHFGCFTAFPAIFVQLLLYSTSVFSVALELAAGGSLFDFLSYTGAFGELIARSYFRQLLDGMNWVHHVCYGQAHSFCHFFFSSVL